MTYSPPAPQLRPRIELTRVALGYHADPEGLERAIRDALITRRLLVERKRLADGS